MPENNIIQVKCSAPGKIILHGEHSVVYGKLAIAASLDLRTCVTLKEKLNGNKVDVNFEDLKFKRSFKINDMKQLFKDNELPLIENAKDKSGEIFLHPDDLDHEKYVDIINNSSLKINDDSLDKNTRGSLLCFFYLFYGILYSAKIPLEPLNISIKTELSLGSGTGSSASLMVSLAGCFLQYLIAKIPSLQSKFQIKEDQKTFNEFQLSLISKWGFAAEKIIHGNPSGIDNTVCTYGSMVSFRKCRAPFAVICKREIKCLIVDTKVPKNTATQVKILRDLKRDKPKIVEPILEVLDTISLEALELLTQLGDTCVTVSDKQILSWYKELGELSSINHHLLCSFGVSHPALNDSVATMLKHNLKGKLTGAGGGGYAYALIPPETDPEEVQKTCDELKDKGYQPMVTKLGGDGVRCEN